MYLWGLCDQFLQHITILRTLLCNLEKRSTNRAKVFGSCLRESDRIPKVKLLDGDRSVLVRLEGAIWAKKNLDGSA